MITFQTVYPDDFEAFSWIARWDNNPEIANFVRPNFTQDPLPQVTAQELQAGARHNQANKTLYLIKANHEPIGYVSIEANFFLLKSQVDAAWISLCIGEKQWRGKGVGQQALNFIEAVAQMQGFSVIELGVFAYNHAAQALYQRCGYEYFTEIPAFVWYQGQQYADLRLKKIISK